MLDGSARGTRVAGIADGLKAYERGFVSFDANPFVYDQFTDFRDVAVFSIGTRGD
eukprot:SAG31_NODE_5113_length_2733_cov_16.639831_4_plen_55_part_00